MGEAHLLRNGRIFTGRRYVEALLIEDDRVIAAGAEARVREAAATGTRSLDLGGHLVLPGLIDSHLHLADLTRARTAFVARGLGSFDELIERLREWARAHPGALVLGSGWEREQFREGRDPDRRILDRAVDDRPVVLYHTSGHAAAVNSAALALAGIDRSTPDPPHGRVGRDSDGTPSGLLYETATQPVRSLAAARFPPVPSELEATLREVVSLGLTTVITMNAGREETEAGRALGRARRLPSRLRVFVRLADLDGLRPDDLGPDGELAEYAVTGVKAFTDGAFGPRTAWLSEPYADAPGEEGLPVGTEEELSESLGRATARGLAPALHAIGDRAVARSVRILEPLMGRTPALPRIEHAAMTPPAILRELGRVRPALVVQPGFLWSDSWLFERLGRSRARWTYAFRTLSDRGLLLAGSSDAPYDPLDPWRGLRACVERADPLGRSANPDPSEALPAEEAVMLYTRNGGRVLGEPDLGELEPGAWADLVRTDALHLAGAFRAGAACVRETWVAGRVVFARTDRSDR
jgi:predicted amidohydrolase YtcJ